jgi:hypothetical protein
MHTLSADIHKGMDVYDSTNSHIGKVDDFKASDEDPVHPGPETGGVSPAERDASNPVFNALADVFSPDDKLPDELQEKLLREGFVRIDSDGLFASDRYITMDQIASVTKDRLTLSVAKDDLIKKH